jgi:hypothetical protein
MLNDSNGNGGGNERINQLVITFDPARLTVNIGGHTENFDIALAMLDMAKRALEARARAEEVRASLARPLIPSLDLRGRQ